MYVNSDYAIKLTLWSLRVSESDEQIKKSGGSKSHSEPPSTLGSPQRVGGLHGLRSAIGLRIRGLGRSDKAAPAHLECGSCGGDAPALRYTRFPPPPPSSAASAAAAKAHPPASKCTSRVANALSILRKHRGASKLLRERSKSDNSLQRLSVVSGSASRSDHALQRLLLRNCSEQHVFLPHVHDSPPPVKQPARRSRSLERSSNFRYISY
jgi:hypothetical protein